MLFWLVAHVFGVVIVVGRSGLIADASILQATISIISAGLLVTLTFVSARNNISTTRVNLDLISVTCHRSIRLDQCTQDRAHCCRSLQCHICISGQWHLYTGWDPPPPSTDNFRSWAVILNKWVERKSAYSLQNCPLGLKLGPGDLKEHLPLGHLAVSWPG